MEHKNKSKSGFTLVELLISIALLAMIVIFVLTIATQMLSLTVKRQSRDIALSLAEAKIEEIKSNLVVPVETFTDEPKPGFKRVVTSTAVYLTKSDTASFLRLVTVQVTTPTAYGPQTVTVTTYIKTAGPQVYFTFPEVGMSYVRHYVSSTPTADLYTYLEGIIRDDTANILKGNVKYRVKDYSGNWSIWYSLSGSESGNIYTDPGPFHSTFAPDTLFKGTTYYFQFKVHGASSDGQVMEIQIQATNTNSISNIQPVTPRGGSSYIQLITDNTAPQFKTIEGLPPTGTVTTGLELGSNPSVDITDPLAGGISSGVYVLYATISKTPSPPGTPTLYWTLSTTTQTPFWTTPDNPGGPYYFPLFYDGLSGKWILNSTYTASLFAQYEPFTTYQIKLCAIDKVIGKRSNYQELIPVQGVPFGLTQLDPSDPASGTLPYAWVDTINNKGAVNANFTATTFVLTMYPKPSIETLPPESLTPNSATLRGQANSYGLPSEVWFEYGPDINYGSSTAPKTFSVTSTTVFPENIGDLAPNTTYHYRAAIQNEWGIFYGEDQTFETTAAPSITVEVPNGGEVWNIGTTPTISWTYSNLTGNVKIELSRDGGATWETIIASTPIDDGQEPWTVTGPTSDNCLIRITSLTDYSISDTSDQKFKITFE